VEEDSKHARKKEPNRDRETQRERQREDEVAATNVHG
jgi:hypothetical protein